MTRVPMTVKGIEKLREELDRLKNIERPRIAKAIGEARALGDLKENAEYHAARELQSFVEGRIQEIEAKLSRAQVIDISKVENDGRIIFGSTAELVVVKTNEKVSYQIVGDDEADIKEQKVSVNSPLARALIGKFIGDTVEVQTPSGLTVYEVVNVQYVLCE